MACNDECIFCIDWNQFILKDLFWLTSQLQILEKKMQQKPNIQHIVVVLPANRCLIWHVELLNMNRSLCRSHKSDEFIRTLNERNLWTFFCFIFFELPLKMRLSYDEFASCFCARWLVQTRNERTFCHSIVFSFGPVWLSVVLILTCKYIHYLCFEIEENVKNGNLRRAWNIQSVVLAFTSPPSSCWTWNQPRRPASQLAVCFPRRSPCGFNNPTECVCVFVPSTTLFCIFRLSLLDMKSNIDSLCVYFLWRSWMMATLLTIPSETFSQSAATDKLCFFSFPLRPIYREYLSHCYRPTAFLQEYSWLDWDWMQKALANMPPVVRSEIKLP